MSVMCMSFFFYKSLSDVYRQQIDITGNNNVISDVLLQSNQTAQLTSFQQIANQIQLKNDLVSNPFLTNILGKRSNCSKSSQ